MSAEEYQHLEQDEGGSGDLPTYDDLAEESGPNSRYDSSMRQYIGALFQLLVSQVWPLARLGREEV
jgi:hypothetical protein